MVFKGVQQRYRIVIATDRFYEPFDKGMLEPRNGGFISECQECEEDGDDCEETDE